MQAQNLTPQNNVCEIRLEVPGNDHFVKKNSDMFEKAITECIDAFQKIIRRTKDKQISKRQSPLSPEVET